MSKQEEKSLQERKQKKTSRGERNRTCACVIMPEQEKYAYLKGKCTKSSVYILILIF